MSPSSLTFLACNICRLALLSLILLTFLCVSTTKSKSTLTSKNRFFLSLLDIVVNLVLADY